MNPHLPAIPVIDVPDGEFPAVHSAAREPDRLRLLIASARRTYSRLGLQLADGRSRRWHGGSRSPYADEVEAVDRLVGRTGVFLLNYAYEWGCTTGAAADSPGVTLLRTLDWPFDGLGRGLVALRQSGSAGSYISLTWPGFAGVLTGMAPGRFAAAINQPPLPLPQLGRAAGWTALRLRVNRSNAMPPSHLLRLAFDMCRDFTEAVELIRTTPVCIPAIFTLAGLMPGDAIAIERTETGACIAQEAASANHWASKAGPRGRPRNRSSLPRRDAMVKLIADPPQWSFDWLAEPILQPDTRLAVMANPLTGRMLAQGWEKTGPATAPLALSEPV